MSGRMWLDAEDDERMRLVAGLEKGRGVRYGERVNVYHDDSDGTCLGRIVEYVRMVTVRA